MSALCYCALLLKIKLIHNFAVHCTLLYFCEQYLHSKQCLLYLQIIFSLFSILQKNQDFTGSNDESSDEKFSFQYCLYNVRKSHQVVFRMRTIIRTFIQIYMGLCTPSIGRGIAIDLGSSIIYMDTPAPPNASPMLTFIKTDTS